MPKCDGRWPRNSDLLLASPDPAVAALVQRLRQQDLRVRAVAAPEDVAAMVEAGRFDLIVIDAAFGAALEGLVFQASHPPWEPWAYIALLLEAEPAPEEAAHWAGLAISALIVKPADAAAVQDTLHALLLSPLERW